jgi:KaiC/GvpD/RAD55 family RecA-like ATPase
MIDNSAVFFGTGILSLDDLLTRHEQRGIGIPTETGFASSTTVIKGGAGVGKSVLAAIISFNSLSRFGWSQHAKSVFVPVPIYFSFSQPAQGVYRYLNQILGLDPKTGNSQDGPIKTGAYPLIISPKPTFEISEVGGIATLRRALIESLSSFRPSVAANASCAGTLKRRQALDDACAGIRNFFQSEHWYPGIDSIDLAPLISINNFNRQFQRILRTEVRYDHVAALMPEFIPFVVIDPINFFFDYRDSREVVAELFSTFRVLKWPVLVTLEDAREDAKDEHRQLASYVEFEADLVIKLAIESEPHIKRTIEVTKSRNSQPRFGQQMYRIEPKLHGFSNIQEGKGFIVIPSIHWFLSSCYRRPKVTWNAHTGIVALDEYFWTESSQLLPNDAFILVKGKKGGHKHSLAQNLLVAGLVEGPKFAGSPLDGGNVMLISLGEETSDTIKNAALSKFIDFDPPAEGHHTRFPTNKVGLAEFIEIENSSWLRKLKPKETDEGTESGDFKVKIKEWVPQRKRKGKSILIEVTFNSLLK